MKKRSMESADACRALLSNKDVQKFRTIYQEQFGIEVSNEEAMEQGIKLLTLMRCIYKPMTMKEQRVIDLHRKSTKSDLIDRLAVK